MKKIAVIVAGGSGTRMQIEQPKQFIHVHGKPILYYTLETFLAAYEDMSVILVLPEEHIGVGQEIIDAYFDYTRIRITKGGRTRFHSVQNGLRLIDDECMVFVHDGVRCCLSTDLIHRCYEAAMQEGSAIPAMPCTDSMRRVIEAGSEAIDRSQLRVIQTPQTFHSKLLLPAFEIDYKDWFTDEATVVEAFGLNVCLIEGEDRNLKVTRPADLVLASYWLQDRSSH